MPTIVSILTFMSSINLVLSRNEHEKSFLTLGPGLIIHIMFLFIFQTQTLQIDFLTKILPNYHYLRKPTKATTPQRN